MKGELQKLIDRTEFGKEQPQTGTLSRAVFDSLQEMPALTARLGSALVDDPPLVLKEGGIFRDGFDSDLDELRQGSREGKNWIAQLQEREIAETGIKSLKVRFNSVFGYFIEITKSNLANVPERYTRKIGRAHV